MISSRPMRLLAVVALVLVAVLTSAPPVAHAAVTVSLAELNGTRLRVQGSGAAPNAGIAIDGTVLGAADASGAFKIEQDPFASPTCVVTVSDGTTSSTAPLSGCTPTAPTPTPIPIAPSPTPATTTTPALAALTLSATSVSGGTTLLGTVTLTAPAPSTAAIVALSSSNPAVAQVSDSVVVSPGFTTALFPITTAFGTTTNAVTIAASFAGVTKTAPLTVGPTQPCGGNGPTVTETLSGPAINGVVPEGRAIADETQFTCGGQTILTVQIKKVNLPDGTVLAVSLDFMPLGTITLSKQQGSLTVSLGHFAVSNDEVRVNNGATTILIGPFFQ